MDSTLNLKQLVIQAQNGDTEAFGKIYDFLLDRVYRFIYFRLSSKEEAEDLTENIFLKIWDNLESYRSEQSIPFEAWVFRIARNAVIDYYRTKKQQVSIETAYEVEDSNNPTVEEIVEANLTKEKVLEALKKLPDSYKEIITLKFIEGLENDEISQILEKPVDQVRVLQSRALKALRKVLNKQSLISQKLEIKQSLKF